MFTEIDTNKLKVLHDDPLQKESTPSAHRSQGGVTILFGLRRCRSEGKGRLEALTVVAAMVSLLLWLTGYTLEKQQLNLHNQANNVKHGRVLSYLTLATELLRHSRTRLCE